MAARSIFLAITRNSNKKVTSRAISSTSEAINVHTEQIVNTTSTHESEEEEEEKDDLKSRIFRLRLPKRSVTKVLQKWVDEGRKITDSDLRNISIDLRRSHRFKHALEISEWMVSNGDEFKVSDSDYALRIDLMTKVFGIDAAERYFEGLPASAKTNETYTALLHSYAASKLIEKAEELYERIKGANLSLSAITYNELMTLYMSVGQLEKVSLIVHELKSKNVAPDLFTYNLWVSSCAAALNVDEVRRILDEMSMESGCKESWIRYIKLAKIYITSSHLVNSDSNSLVESEKGIITQRELIAYDFLVVLYGGLGNKDKLDQIWKSLKMTGQKITGRNYVCILSSYMMLGHVKEVSDIIDEWKKSATSEFNGSLCNKLVEAFKENGLPDKATSFLMLVGENE